MSAMPIVMQSIIYLLKTTNYSVASNLIRNFRELSLGEIYYVGIVVSEFKENKLVRKSRFILIKTCILQASSGNNFKSSNVKL